jgi:hypothetical protein
MSADVVFSPGNESEHAMDVRLKRRRSGPNRSVEGDTSAGPAAAVLDQAERLKLGTLDGHLGYFLRRLQIAVFKDFIRTLAPMDVRPAQYSVLLLIEANPGRSQAAIGQALDIERARPMAMAARTRSI